MPFCLKLSIVCEEFRKKYIISGLFFMGNLHMPGQLRAFFFLSISVFLFQTAHFVIFDIDTIRSQSPQASQALIYSMYAIVIILYACILYKTFKAKSWARILWTLVTLFFIIATLKLPVDYKQYPVLLAFVNILLNTLDIISLVLLWHPATNRWFKEMKPVRPAKKEIPTVKTNAENDTDNSDMSAHTASAQDSPANTEKHITYKNLLKILRVVRVVYVVSITLILIMVTSFYGIIVRELSRQPATPDVTQFATVDIAVVNLSVAILFLSLLFVIAENLIDRKLQSYPAELVDRSYSNKALLIVSFLYVYCFFALNNWIISSFILMKVNHQPGILHLIYWISIGIVIVIFVFIYLVRKINNRKMWKYYWIFVPVIFLSVGPTEMFVIKVGRIFISKPFIFIMKFIKTF